MPFIQEINEVNYAEEVEEGQAELNKKFKLLDDLLATKAGDPERVAKMVARDPTLWAYAVLKDDQGNRLKFHPFQDRIINDKNRFVMVCASNQIGKTLDACVKALHHALYVNSACVLIVSKSERQATRVLDVIKWLLRSTPYKADDIKDGVENRTELHLKSPDGKHASTIICVTPTESALGYPASLVICDEISFWENGEYIYEQVLEPRTNSTKNWKHPNLTMGQIFCISNPNGQQEIGWKLWNDERFSKYRYCWLANPNNTLEEYKLAEKRLPSDRFDSIYAATFTSATGGFVTRQEFEDACKNELFFKIEDGEPFFLGADFAGEDTHSRDVDLSVLYGVQKNMDTNEIKLVYYKEFPERTAKSEIYDEIERLNDLYGIQLFAYDKPGVGDSVLNDLTMDRKILSVDQVEPLTYSLPQKSEVYYNIKHLFEQRNIKIPGFDGLDKLKEQLMNLKFVKTQGGHIKVHGAASVITKRMGGREITQFQGEKHDDHADAFANACYAARLESSMPSAKWV